MKKIFIMFLNILFTGCNDNCVRYEFFKLNGLNIGIDREGKDEFKSYMKDCKI